jgi:uncharacterized membrane protein YdjX (TVP38/TMEM64 family)
VRFLFMVALLLAAYFLFRDSSLAAALEFDRIQAQLADIRATSWAPLALIGLWAVLSPLALPATPLMLAGGAVFGPWLGTLYNWIGAITGAATTYFFARLLGHDLVAHLLGEERLSRLEDRISAYGFWALAGIRLIPIPWPAVNFAAALSGYPFTSFLASTMVGIGPILFVFSLFAASLVDVAGNSEQAVVKFVIALAALGLFGVLRIWLRHRGLSSREPSVDRLS